MISRRSFLAAVAVTAAALVVPSPASADPSTSAHAGEGRRFGGHWTADGRWTEVVEDARGNLRRVTR